MTKLPSSFLVSGIRRGWVSVSSTHCNTSATRTPPAPKPACCPLLATYRWGSQDWFGQQRIELSWYSSFKISHYSKSVVQSNETEKWGFWEKRRNILWIGKQKDSLCPHYRYKIHGKKHMLGMLQSLCEHEEIDYITCI